MPNEQLFRRHKTEPQILQVPNGKIKKPIIFLMICSQTRWSSHVGSWTHNWIPSQFCESWISFITGFSLASVFCGRFHFVYVVKGVWSLLTILFLTRTWTYMTTAKCWEVGRGRQPKNYNQKIRKSSNPTMMGKRGNLVVLVVVLIWTLDLFLSTDFGY